MIRKPNTTIEELSFTNVPMKVHTKISSFLISAKLLAFAFVKNDLSGRVQANQLKCKSIKQVQQLEMCQEATIEDHISNQTTEPP